MKNLKLFTTIFAFAITLFSCSSDEEAKTQTELLTGKWQISQQGYTDSETGIEKLSDYNPSCTTKKDYYEFTSAGIYREVFFYDCAESISNGTWSITDGKLYKALDGTASIGYWQIVELTETKLKVKFTSTKSAVSKTAKSGYDTYVFTKI